MARVIVADDHSTDGTLDRLQTLVPGPDLAVIRHETNHGKCLELQGRSSRRMLYWQSLSVFGYLCNSGQRYYPLETRTRSRRKVTCTTTTMASLPKMIVSSLENDTEDDGVDVPETNKMHWIILCKPRN